MTSQKETTGYGERIAAALHHGPRPMSVRALAREAEDAYPDLRGTSYGGIRQYAEGGVRHPRVELLRAIADILGVRSDWLAFDEGPMTEAEAAAGTEATRGLDLSDWAAARHRERQETLEAVLGRIPTVAAPVLHTTIRRLAAFGEGDWMDAADDLARALAAPAERFRVRLSRCRQDDVTDYLTTVALALARLAEADPGLESRDRTRAREALTELDEEKTNG